MVIQGLVIRMLDCLRGLGLAVLQERALRGGAVQRGQKASMWVERGMASQ